jgi:hypothetical protein
MRAICAAVDRPTGAQILCGHLLDEIEGAGYSDREIHVSASARARAPDCIDADLDRIGAAARQHPDRPELRQIIHALAVLAEAVPAGRGEVPAAAGLDRRMAAEPPAPARERYRTRTDRNTPTV